MAGGLLDKLRLSRRGKKSREKEKAQDGSETLSSIALATAPEGLEQQSPLLTSVLRPEHPAPSTPPAPPLARSIATPSTLLPQATSSALPGTASYASSHNAAGKPAAPPKAEISGQAANTREHSAADGSPDGLADHTPRALEAGLHVIFDSTCDGQPLSVAEIDVVAVHGLNFKGSANHAQETWTSGGKLWLKDFLPASLSKPARVMLFAYNSSPAIGASAIKLDDHAKQLLHWLNLRREGVPQRPIVFICHSLGGLVVKQALVEAKLDTSYTPIIEATCLLVFFSTPHQGGKYASVGEVVAKIATAALRNPNNDLLDALKLKSNEATRRFEQARHLFERCLVVSFFEAESYHKTDIIVDKNSATLNLPGSREKQVAIDANHSAICKFDSKDSSTCELVLMTIAAEVKRGLESAQKYCGPDPTSLDERDLECLRALRLTNPRDDKIRIQQEKGGLLEGSYSWVLDNDNFRQWRDNQENRLLWINGDPGKGKTMLLCGIIDELVKSATHTTNVSFFFCQATNGDINDATAVLRGLLYLFVKQQPSLISQVRETYDDSGKKCFEGPNAWVALSKMFTSILKDERLHDTYLIIDALDECVTGLSLLLTLIVQESAAYSNVKWIVSSRNWPSIEKDLNTATQKATLCLELNEKSVSRAVAAYVRFKVDQLAARNKYRPGTRDAVERYLSLHAYGTFLWVALVCHELRDVSWDVQRKLKAFPPGLDALYQRMVRQICGSEHAELCKNILAVISAVRRPITLDELETFVDMPEEASASYEVLAEIIGHCGSFLTLQERTISFVHQSAKDFLVQEASKNSLSRIQDPRIQDSWIKDSWIQDAHRSIFLRSLQVMTDTLRRDIYNLYAPGFPIGKVELPTPDPLAAARYSCVYWIDHLDDCSADDQKKYLQEKGPVDTFLQQKYLYWLEALSLLRSVSNGVLAMARLEGLLQGCASQFASLVRDGRRFVQYHNTIIENNPLQV